MRHAFAAIMHPVLPWLDLPQYAVCAICAALSLRSGRPLPANLATFPLRPRCAIVAALAGIAGAAVERWLFFAEARHVVNLYHGAQRC